jgi:peptidoglycan/LPS O-acetylase OafA/YrhL
MVILKLPLMDPTATTTPEETDLVPNLPLPENKKFYPALDGLRAIAVLMVFYQHYLVYPAALHWGWAGVDVFFVLSGFLITGILYDTRADKHRLHNFYVRRTLRIFPLYYGLFALALITTPIFHWVWDKGWWVWLLYMGNFAQIGLMDGLSKNLVVFDYLHPTRLLNPQFSFIFGHFWSLCLEEQFYLVWPFVVYWIKDRVRLRNLCAVVILIMPLIRLVCNFTMSPEMLQKFFLYRFTPVRADALLLGAFVALCLRGPEADRIASLARPVGKGILAIFFLITVGSLILTHQAPSPATDSLWVSTIGFTLLDVLAASVLLRALDPHSHTFRFLNVRWLRWLGQMSYGFYVFHNFVHPVYAYMVRSVLGSNFNHINLPIAVVGFIGTILISYLSYRFYETRFLRLKDRFTR